MCVSNGADQESLCHHDPSSLPVVWLQPLCAATRSTFHNHTDNDTPEPDSRPRHRWTMVCVKLTMTAHSTSRQKGASKRSQETEGKRSPWGPGHQAHAEPASFPCHQCCRCCLHRIAYAPVTLTHASLLSDCMTLDHDWKIA